jgi:hypothetical protein
MKKTFFYLLILLAILITSCGSKKYPKFDKVEAFAYLNKQCEFGTREPGSEGIKLCREYIKDTLNKYGAVVKEQKFATKIHGNEIQSENILASFNPRLSRRILLGAHYDTRPWADKDENLANHNKPIPGANDGASGVAVLLEIAKIISQKEPQEFGVDMVFFDLEDSGSYNDDKSWCKGSQFYADNFSGDKPEAAIIIDMIGDRDLQIPMEFFSYHNSPVLTSDIWEIAENLGFRSFQNKIGIPIYDDHYPLLESGFNVIDIIDMKYKYWHTLQDLPKNCSSESLYEVGQTLINYIYREK